MAEELVALGREHDDAGEEASGYHLAALVRLESGQVEAFDDDLRRVDALRLAPARRRRRPTDLLGTDSSFPARVRPASLGQWRAQQQAR